MGIAASILLGIGILIGIGCLYLLFVALVPGIRAPSQHLEKAKQPFIDADAKISWSKKDVSFNVKNTSISAWQYLPENSTAPVPCIIMGHGFGGTRDMGLERYAVRYLAAGYAVLMFDYRYFGESDGQPRQLIWFPYQLEDWLAAINYTRSLKEIDPAKIALWGTSASGGHVIVSAAKDKDIACVTAQCPGLDGRASAMTAFKNEGLNFRLIVHAQRDLVRSWLGLSPHKIPIVGKPGSIACITSSDAYAGYAKLASENFINETCGRIAIRADKYRPVKHARNVSCPVLLQICDHDSITPKSATLETEKELGKFAEVKNYPIGHFDIYFGDNFEVSVSDQLKFFKKHL
jgi:dienelactone hydrolase